MALAFFRAERGTGSDRVEALPFFKRQDAYDRFKEYASSGVSGHHRGYAKAAARLRTALTE